MRKLLVLTAIAAFIASLSIYMYNDSQNNTVLDRFPEPEIKKENRKVEYIHDLDHDSIKENYIIKEERIHTKEEVLIDLKTSKKQEEPENIKSIKKDKPTSMREVTLTPGIKKGLEDFGPGTYEKYDYMLGFLARLEQCFLDNKIDISYQGSVPISLVFNIDQEKQIGTGTDFSIEPSSIGDTEESHLQNCGYIAHINYTIDVKNMINLDMGEDELYFLPTLEFPLDDNPVYVFIKNDGALP